LLDPLAIHEGAIGTPQVADDKIAARTGDFHVALGNFLGGNGKMVFLVAADAKGQRLQRYSVHRSFVSGIMLEVGEQRRGRVDTGLFHIILWLDIPLKFLPNYRLFPAGWQTAAVLVGTELNKTIAELTSVVFRTWQRRGVYT
jgi:hypothetical protein